jgi:hypothetical protein
MIFDLRKSHMTLLQKTSNKTPIQNPATRPPSEIQATRPPSRTTEKMNGQEVARDDCVQAWMLEWCSTILNRHVVLQYSY